MTAPSVQNLRHTTRRQLRRQRQQRQQPRRHLCRRFGRARLAVARLERRLRRPPVRRLGLQGTTEEGPCR